MTCIHPVPVDLYLYSLSLSFNSDGILVGLAYSETHRQGPEHFWTIEKVKPYRHFCWRKHMRKEGWLRITAKKDFRNEKSDLYKTNALRSMVGRCERGYSVEGEVNSAIHVSLKGEVLSEWTARHENFTTPMEASPATARCHNKMDQKLHLEPRNQRSAEKTVLLDCF